MCSDSVAVRVPGDRLGLLKEVLEKRDPELLRMFRDSSLLIRADQRRAVQDWLADELVESGLGGDGEPTERGRHLDELIDVFSPY